MEKPSVIYLIESCRKGSRKAQLELYRRYAAFLYPSCLRMTGNSQDAEEVMQDTFLKILTRLDKYRQDISFVAWMQRIAIHTALDFLRCHRQPVWEELTEQTPVPPEEEEEEPAYSVSEIKKGMEKLPDGYRIVLSLMLFEGYDTEEIAAILQIRPVSVRSQYMRARKKLQDLIKRSHHGPVKTIHRA